ncbi:acetate--CoA ligase family protein [Lutibacter citreus]|uniref:acetate--CoA ligase family protein n=1 Tax=Lutibacter citreus TaxID=2138210 RepID=UPI000DBE3FC5|nr:acetate--CoA ligase family protein [Lutibacter citreus]
MLNKKLLNPSSIVIIGASNNTKTPGGSVLKNLINNNFKGELFAVNPKAESVQGIKCFQNIHELPEVDLAIIAIASKYVLETVKELTQNKNTKGFIIFSAGFSEKDEDGAKLEHAIVQEINAVGGTLLGPNNIGLINQNYAGAFTSPIPKINKKGVDFISGSGATAVFIIEAAKSTGLTFSSVYSVGNSAQIGVEEILEHLDESFDSNTSSKIKLLYIESIENPQKLLKHAISLVKKGCKIAAIKAGSSEAGSRAASSHTGALANSDLAVDALFKKARIVRCYSRNELINVASIFTHPKLKGNNIAIITHAGGPAVMLTDTLSKNGLNVPKLDNLKSEELLTQLYHGSSVANPIDFLATGNAEQLGIIIDYCEHHFSEIDAIVVIFGSPGLFEVYDVYETLHNKIRTCKKPIFAIMPSVINVKNEIDEFISKGNISFPDEVLFGEALGRVYNTSKAIIRKKTTEKIDRINIRKIIDNSENGYLNTYNVKKILQAAKIPTVPEFICKTLSECSRILNKIEFPVVMKVVGPIHKSDVGGIILNINSEKELTHSYQKLMQIKNVEGVLIQPMKKGIELFIGAKREGNFGHLILCGLGGIYIEVLKDIKTSLAPVSKNEAIEMIQSLKSYKIIQGVRNQEGVSENIFTKIILKVSNLVTIAPEIIELDLNPLIGNSKEIIAVDARIKIEK